MAGRAVAAVHDLGRQAGRLARGGQLGFHRQDDVGNVSDGAAVAGAPVGAADPVSPVRVVSGADDIFMGFAVVFGNVAIARKSGREVFCAREARK